MTLFDAAQKLGLDLRLLAGGFEVRSAQPLDHLVGERRDSGHHEPHRTEEPDERKARRHRGGSGVTGDRGRHRVDREPGDEGSHDQSEEETGGREVASRKPAEIDRPDDEPDHRDEPPPGRIRGRSGAERIHVAPGLVASPFGQPPLDCVMTSVAKDHRDRHADRPEARQNDDRPPDVPDDHASPP